LWSQFPGYIGYGPHWGDNVKLVVQDRLVVKTDSATVARVLGARVIAAPGDVINLQDGAKGPIEGLPKI
jgi:hypothetical protein